MQIVRYTKDNKEIWDAFVDKSKNGTFLLKRDYMDYHSDRFTDCSFLFFDKDKLVAVLPANVNEEEHTLYSHQGLTYGGIIMIKSMTTVQMLELFDELIPFVKHEYDIERIVYKSIPYIYSTYPAEEDLYALFRNKAALIERKISSAICLDSPLSFKQSRKGGVSKAKKNGLAVALMRKYEDYWSILSGVLSGHQANPVHSIEEIERLTNLFPENIYGYEVKKDNIVLAGCVIYETSCVAHVQYIAASEEGKELGALDLLFDYLIKERFLGKRYFEFGISTEQGGWYLNEGLIFQKEGFGARGVVYDIYELKI